MPTACVVIVDPYSSGALLAGALADRGVRCIAVHSSPTLPAHMKSRYNSEAFCEVLHHGADCETTLHAVARHRPTHVIAGFESGVELAEWLGWRLGLPTNDPELREARRDKYAMAQAARRHGLRTAQQFCSSHIDELIAWTRKSLDWPVIAKPARSVASDHVFRCHGLADLQAAAEAILRDVNILGTRNATVVVQDFLRGTEYAVDTVSCDGRHKLTAVWQYFRPADETSFVCYNGMRLLPYHGQRQQELQRYAYALLDAVGVRFGPAHCELMWTPAGPTLIEMGARMIAGNLAVLSGECGGIAQLDETIHAIVAPGQFHAARDEEPSLDRHAASVFLMAPRCGTLVRTRYVEKIQALPTLHGLSLPVRAGERIGRVAGRVTLMHPSWEAIERDMEVIDSLERQGLFVVHDQQDDDVGYGKEGV